MLLRNGTLVNGEKTDILIINGKIYLMKKEIDVFEAGRIFAEITGEELKVIDIENKYIMPGVIDVHTHMRDPGFTHKEDFLSGSKACAKAGITTFIDMPNTNPATVTKEALELKRKSAGEKSVVNFGFHFGGSSDNNAGEIKKVSGVLSTKVFLNVSTGKMLVEDDNVLEDIVKAANFLTVHAEGGMINKALEFNKQFGKGLYVCHVSSREEMNILIKAKADKVLNNEKHPVFAEVTPHHLFLDEEMKDSDEEKKMLYRMKPELKTKADREYLWECIGNGAVDTIGTDHAPHLIREKMEKITFGMPGVETLLALMLTAYNQGKISLEKIQELMCGNPAKIFGIKNKGVLKEGYDADIIIVDTNEKWIVKKEDLLSKCGWSPYEGWELKGKNVLTIVNGNIVYKDGKIFENKGKEVEIDE
ncbi:dihydroorotase family protein [Sebaldella sp. S0638]|uniref:dihydroorotase n=1 Tax=Sebaldella sp. S0638 TaxID=2957809 RepID=UPI00209D33B8|nr:dihydroorotase family protein [Sebaldella sp. S0638]MCP1225127.1 dihydroorotase family protein [Sebaldella sp. S0638]